MEMKSLLMLVLFGSIALTSSETNEIIDPGGLLKTVIGDDDFGKFIVDNYYVVALFVSKEDMRSGRYKEMVYLIGQVETEITDGLNGQLVQLIDSKLPAEYGIPTPALLFFRKQIPSAYDGPLVQKDIAEWLQYKRRPSFQEIDDHDFDYYTDAMAGNKGDWLILFCRQNCRPYLVLFEAIHSRVAGKVSLGRVRLEPNVELINRFDIRDVPTYMLFSGGKMYRYTGTQRDLAVLTKFALEKHQSTPAVKVPPVKEYIQTRSQRFLRYEYNEKHIPAAIMCLGLPFTIVLAAICVKCVTPELPIKQQ